MNEMSSVKEMIFKRAKEKSSTLAEERNEQMTASVQNDVMAEARASISSNRISFGGLTQTKKFEPQNTQPEQVQEAPTKEPNKLKHNIQSVENSTYTAAMQDEVMRAAHKQYSRKTNVMECLNFLNTQAAISLVNSTRSAPQAKPITINDLVI